MLEIPKRTAICAARHYVAAHESVCTGEPVNWASPCEQCGEFAECRADWIEVMAPLFDAVGIHPQIGRPLNH